MFRNLRSRLLLSYFMVIGLTLCMAGLALFLLLLNNPLPSRTTYENLATIARTAAPFLLANPDQVDRRLDYIAQSSNTRVLRLSPEGNILYDSGGLQEGSQPISLSTVSSGGEQPQRGTFRSPGGQIWLYVAVRPENFRPELGILVFAAPRPRAPLLSLLGENLARPLIQAGIIGLLASVALAVLISRSIVRPLRKTAGAARAIARGDYEQNLPEGGPEEVRELSSAFNYMAQQVRRSQKTQQDFLANVSHELKTPLTSIQGYSQAILDGAATDPRKAATVIYDEAGRMRRMVDELLDLARIESGQTLLRRDYIDLPGIVNAVIAMLAPQASEKDISLLHHIADLPPITGDGDRLAQVITNLVDNAITHTPRRGLVTVDVQPLDGGVEIAVKDNGPGIPASELVRVFERFYQVDKSRKRGSGKGTGLGLTISKEIVEAHNGQIRVESEPNQGTTFYVWLPCPQSDDETVHRLHVRR
nr:HAMP domain-containing histidine kinase [Anaerolineae bacterium]